METDLKNSKWANILFKNMKLWNRADWRVSKQNWKNEARKVME